MNYKQQIKAATIGSLTVAVVMYTMHWLFDEIALQLNLFWPYLISVLIGGTLAICVFKIGKPWIIKHTFIAPLALSIVGMLLVVVSGLERSGIIDASPFGIAFLVCLRAFAESNPKTAANLGSTKPAPRS